MPDYADIKSIRNFKSLVKYLRKELGWPVDEEQADDLTFEYLPDELGLDEDHAVKVREIKQIRPLVANQPWGIFWIDFEPKRLPVVVMRRVLAALVKKKRATGKKVDRATWDLRDLMFISATGGGNERGISFAHFRETEEGGTQLRTFSWDVRESHLYYIKNLNLDRLQWPAQTDDIAGWREGWASAFMVGHREPIKTAQALASRMAQLAADTRERVNEVYQLERKNGALHKLYDAFKKVLIHDLSTDDFADMYAQTITYGLFSARATRSGEFALENVTALIPNTNPFLRDLFGECLKVGAGGKRQIDLDELGVGELMETLKEADIESVLRDFGRQTRGEDPVIHFYESFLKEYDAEKKAKRGVFYTPDPVVSFIVRSVDYLLRKEFGCKDGLATVADKKENFDIQVLDPATGTGTFLKYVIEQIYDTFQTKHKNKSAAERKKLWNEYVPKHLLPRLYGFELMMAPYAVAHMKLGLTLKHTEYDFNSDERLRLYLTNALQSVDEIPRTDTAFLAHEAEEANEVKSDTPITIIVGNPPYSGHSANASKNADGSLNFIGRLLREYYFVDGRPLGEANPRWLQDDYVKFIRWAQWRIELTGAGVLAMITNHGYLNNPTFRGMRQQLMRTFNEIYLLDLHGNIKHGETALDGSEDKNVFDIQQGVAICLMIKHLDQAIQQVSVWHADLYGMRQHKYEALLLGDMKAFEWTKIAPRSPFYSFVLEDIGLRSEWDQGWIITEMMPVSSVGIVTARDNLTIHWKEDEVIPTIKEFASLPIEVAREKYELGEDARDWKVSLAQQDVRSTKIDRSKVKPILYRPFDVRHTYYTSQSRGFICMPRPDVMRHMLDGNNIGLVSARSNKSQSPDHFFCSQFMTEAKSGESTTQSCLFPLYLYPGMETRVQASLFSDSVGVGPNGRRPNLSLPNSSRMLNRN